MEAAGRDRNREAIAGSVERVTFHNPEAGSGVLWVKLHGQRDLLTIVGHAATISAGEFARAGGVWASDRTHAVQFKAAFRRAAPGHDAGANRAPARLGEPRFA